jgi:predicted GIY-YIG superfamily endonuclease
MTKTAVYRFYDASGRLLYVGITANTTARWGRHKAKAAWWADRQRVEVTWHDDRVAAATEEYRAIRSENPIWNRAHTKAAGRTPYEPASEVLAAPIMTSTLVAVVIHGK